MCPCPAVCPTKPYSGRELLFLYTALTAPAVCPAKETTFSEASRLARREGGAGVAPGRIGNRTKHSFRYSMYSPQRRKRYIRVRRMRFGRFSLPCDSGQKSLCVSRSGIKRRRVLAEMWVVARRCPSSGGQMTLRRRRSGSIFLLSSLFGLRFSSRSVVVVPASAVVAVVVVVVFDSIHFAIGIPLLFSLSFMRPRFNLSTFSFSA